MKLDDGEYPHVQINSGNFSTQHVSTVSTHKKVDFYSLTVASTAALLETPTANHNVLDLDKHFYLATEDLTISTISFYCGHSKWTFQGKTSGVFIIPTQGALSTYGTNGEFNCKIRHLVIDSTANGAGSKAQIPDGSVLNLDSLTIESGAILIASGGCAIFCSSVPNIQGSWSFKQMAVGLYLPQDDEFLLGLGHGGTGQKSLGLYNQVLRVNSSRNCLLYTSPSPRD